MLIICSCPRERFKKPRIKVNYMKILIGSDHAGFKLKEELKRWLVGKGYGVNDYGTDSTKAVDYPKIGFKLAKDAAKQKKKGILICGSGLGMSMAANKIKGIRASLCYDVYTAKAAREHNDANILCLGSRVLTEKKAKKISDVWLKTKFSNKKRHIRRVRELG